MGMSCGQAYGKVSSHGIFSEDTHELIVSSSTALGNNKGIAFTFLGLLSH